MPSRQRLDG